jgi:hypothetical protein
VGGCCECGHEPWGSSAELVGHRYAVALVAGLVHEMLPNVKKDSV